MNHPSEQSQEPQLGKAIRLLGDLLGKIIVSQSGEDVFQLEEEIRALSKASRAGDEEASQRLIECTATLAEDLPRTANIVKAFSTYFQLVNLVEEHERVRILRERSNTAFCDREPMDESIADAIATLHREGITTSELKGILQRLHIVPVFTAHPTESRRRTVRQILKQVSQTLAQLQSTATLEFEAPPLIAKLRSYVVLLWQSDETRHRRPMVMDEVRNTGLYFFKETLFDIVPQVYEELQRALDTYYPDETWDIPAFLKYGSWIGGDRDGNPLVTNDVTQSALQAQKEVALERYADDLSQLYELISVSKNRSSFSPDFIQQLGQDFEVLDVADDDVVGRFELEPYRQQFILMYRRIVATRAHNQGPWDSADEGPVYTNAEEFLEELKVVRNSLHENNGEDLVQGLLSQLIRRVEVFGFHLATIDVRQHAGRHRQAMAEILTNYEITENYVDSSEADKVAILTREIESNRPLTAELNFGEATNEVISVFRLIRRAQRNIGDASMQTYVISMTSSVSNMLEVLLLMKDADLFGKIDLVPLFETVDDLNRSSETMLQLFQEPTYQRHLALRGNQQQIMIGYSDSNKDGGYLQANWMLFTSQRKLAQSCEQLGVQLTLFHGRGGSLGRGGGPANRAILSQPPESVNGRIRVTEQGEVVSSRYSHPGIAHRHLQQMMHAVLCSTGKRPQFAKLQRWSEIMGDISKRAHVAYRELVGHPQFIDYFQSATPIELVENLNIGSRPSRRKSSKSIDDLRAIPWVFSWTQSRANISSWYGIGTAIEDWCAEVPERMTELQEMFTSWPFFTTLFKNVHLGLGRADMKIAALYSRLARDGSETIFESIQQEFECTERVVLQITKHEKILDTESWLQHSIRMRNPYVDPLNYIQVALLERLRSQRDQDPEVRDELMRVLANAVNGIAAGLQSVG